jgi:hypothetical protein
LGKCSAQLLSACSDLVEAAEILERSLIAAEDQLGVLEPRFALGIMILSYV